MSIIYHTITLHTFPDSLLYFVTGFVSSFLYYAVAARESELKRCRFGQVSIDFESDAL